MLIHTACDRMGCLRGLRLVRLTARQQRDIAFAPVVLVERVFIEVKTGHRVVHQRVQQCRMLAKTRPPGQPRHCRACVVGRPVGADEFGVFGTAVQNIAVRKINTEFIVGSQVTYASPKISLLGNCKIGFRSAERSAPPIDGFD